MGPKQSIKFFGIFWFERTPGKYWRLSRKYQDGWLIIASDSQRYKDSEHD